MTGRPRTGLSLFARTFLLLIVSLLVAQGIGLALLLTRTALRPPRFTLTEVVALLSSRIPPSDSKLKVTTTAAPPVPPHGGGYRADAGMQRILAEWLDQPVATVRFYVSAPTALPWNMPLMDGPATAPAGPGDDGPIRRGPGPDGGPPFAHPHPEDTLADRQGPGPGGPDAGRRPPFSLPPMGPGATLRGNFVAAARSADGRWRVVEYHDTAPAAFIRHQVLLLLLLGALAMLPLAWWFSRALAAPIRRFAEAADRLGRDPHAPPLPTNGAAELAQAAASFNTMQGRINRLLDERTQMVGAIAHDLRTPLARLSFRLDGLPTDQRDKADADIEEMKNMISAALDFLRNQASPHKRQRLDFGLLVESVVDGMTDMGRDVTLDGQAGAVLAGDPDGLRRVIANLVENALKYGHRARLSLHNQGDHCELWVDDDGPGVPEGMQERLLLPFVRGEASRNRDTGGIGLGLSVAHDVVLAHGGELHLVNRPEGGLRAIVRLPCEPATKQAAKQAANQAPPPQ